jgi:hypothetical protein
MRTALRPVYYVLEGKTPVPADRLTRLEWFEWFESYNRCVAETITPNDVCISTVFLGIDWQHRPDGPPLLFETKIFGGWKWDETRRYSTWEEAEAGHAEVVALALALVN